MGEHSPMSGGSRWHYCSMRDFQTDFLVEVFSRRCEKQEGDEVP